LRQSGWTTCLPRGVKTVFHLAQSRRHREFPGGAPDMFGINVQASFELLEWCVQSGVERVFFASTGNVYAPSTAALKEDADLGPSSFYGASKLAGEALCSSYYHSFDLKTIVLRFANAYGPYSDHKSIVITAFVRWAREGKPLIIYGDGKQTRDFVHVDDICQAIHLSLTARDSGHTHGEIFQIASGIETTINEISELINDMAEKKLKIIHEPERKGEIRRNYSDIGKARIALGFEPRVGLREGLRDLWQ